MRVADRFWNSYVHSHDRLRRLSARSLHTWVLTRITTAVCNRDDRSAQKKGRKKKEFNIPQWRIRIDPSTSNDRQRKSSGARRISLVHGDSASVCRPHRKSTTGSRKSRFSRSPPPTVDICPLVVGRAEPGAFVPTTMKRKTDRADTDNRAAIDSNQRSPNQWIRGIMAARAIVWNWVFPNAGVFLHDNRSRHFVPLHQLTRLRQRFRRHKIIRLEGKKDLQNVQVLWSSVFDFLFLADLVTQDSREEKKIFWFCKIK